MFLEILGKFVCTLNLCTNFPEIVTKDRFLSNPLMWLSEKNANSPQCLSGNLHRLGFFPSEIGQFVSSSYTSLMFCRVLQVTICYFPKCYTCSVLGCTNKKQHKTDHHWNKCTQFPQKYKTKCQVSAEFFSANSSVNGHDCTHMNDNSLPH